MSGSTIIVAGVISLAGSLVGLKIIWRAWTLREPAAWFIGIAMLTHSSISQPAMIAFLSNPTVRPPLLSLSTPIAVACVFAFVWRVFRAQNRWAAVFASTAILVMLVGTVVILFVTNRGSPEQRLLGVIHPLGFLVATLWGGVEALLYRRRLLKRARINLSNPVVENRLLIWGSTMLAASVLAVGVAAFAAMGKHGLAMGLAFGIGINGTVGWYLGFTPPATYCDWIEARAARGVARGDET
ncbi:MAG TPA: hypothetical protein DEP35_12200 [Deltaproteobacteria bacterium]|nr:hypothetical protein [Deltaproteobacteria bacterium]